MPERIESRQERPGAGTRGAASAAKPGARTPGRRGRILRLALYTFLALLILPFLLTPFYRVVDPVSTLMLWRWLKGARVERAWTPIGAMATVLPRTVVAAEDARFCLHRGVEWNALRSALAEAADGADDVRGRSTITQQTAKNLFLWPGRSYVRKALELPLALWIDLVIPKRRVLEIYLNVAEWGPAGEFGIAAGAKRAFAKTPRDLNAREAALLAAVLPNPAQRNARNPGRGMQRLAGRYQARAPAVARTTACLGLRG